MCAERAKGQRNMINTDMEEGMDKTELVVFGSKGRAGRSYVTRCDILTVASWSQFFEEEVSGRFPYLAKNDTWYWSPLTWNGT
jgi:hypothetical protein